MHDAFRQRLSKDEQEAYDLFDSRASLASHFVVWPVIAAVISYSAGRPLGAMICFAIVLVAAPVMVIMGSRARRIRETAEARYLAIMDGDTKPGDGPDNGQGAR